MRPLDLVVFGATGFTGRLVAEHLARSGQGRWGLAGRDYDALRRLRADLTDLAPSAADAEVLTARAEDPGALGALAERARVVVAAAGPYARVGEPLVAACVEAGTHYVDLSAEPGWWSAMVSRYHGRALERRVRIVPACGFDAVPADLGAQFTLEQLAGEGDVELDAYVAVDGGFSGGSWRSILEERARRGGPHHVHRANGGRGLHFARDARRWVVPTRAIDPLVVERSAHLAHSRRLRYRQYAQARSLPEAGVMMLGDRTTDLLARLPPAREALVRLRPGGSGPPPARRAASWFRIRFVARTERERVVTEVRGGDPGYEESAKMVAEAARELLAQTEGEADGEAAAGVLTPAVALGVGLRRRLDAQGVRFRLVSRETL